MFTTNMPEKFCRCCLKTDCILLSTYSESTHNDNKTLEDYLNKLLSYSKQTDVKYSTQICERCIKALQIAYHFLLMSMDSKRKFEEMCQTKSVSSYNTKMGNPSEKNYVINLQPEITENGTTFNNEFSKTIKWKLDLSFVKQVENETEVREDELNLIEEDLQENDESQYDNDNKDIENSSEEDSKNQAHIFECRTCGESFTLHESLIEHNQREHKRIIPFKCTICNFYTCFIESLAKHYKIQHELEDVENRLYKTGELLAISAEKQAIYDKTFECKECNFKTHTQTQIYDHLSVQHDINEEKDTSVTIWFNCPLCYHKFNKIKSLKIHRSMAHNSKPKTKTSIHQCEKCAKTFYNKSSLVSHERFCEFREPTTCYFCKLQFSSVMKFENHLKDKHSVDIKHECEVCHKNFKTSAHLRAHRRRHNERYSQCHLCPKNYINNAELIVHHKRIHSQFRNIMCSICRKIFEQPQQLREHMKTDHDKEPISCDYCDFKSTSKYAIQVHQYRHTGSPYKCQFCSKQYVLRKDIKEHSKKVHGFDISDDALAEMFVHKHGYPSRFDAFSQQNNDLQLDVIDEVDLATELKEFNLTFEDIMNDLFDDKNEGDWDME